MKDNHKKMNNQDNTMKGYKQRLFHQTPLKILSFLARYSGKIFCEREIHNITKSSAGAVNQTLKLLLELGIVTREKKGNLFLYSINSDNYLTKYFKIFETLLYIHDFIEEIKPYAYEIILYGSCAEGANAANSDIDIFIKTEYISKVRKIANKYRAMDDSLKAVILDPLEVASSKKIDEVFYNEVKKGIVLWRGKPTYAEI